MQCRAYSGDNIGEDKAENIAIDNGLLDKAKSNAKKVLKNFIYNIYDSNDYDIVFEDVKG